MTEARAEQLACVVLAAGRGTRMRSSTLHKVCFPVAGRPAILRAMEAYREAGVTQFVVVVGAMAGQVMETVGPDFPEAIFVYQPVRLGTGNATRLGVAPLQALGFTGDILVTMGDKLVEASAVQRLLRARADTGLEVVVGVTRRRPGSEGGRILFHADGRLAGILEKRDIEKARLVEQAAQVIELGQAEAAAACLQSLAEAVRGTFPEEAKRRLALGELGEAIERLDLGALKESLQTGGRQPLELGESRFSAADAEAAALENNALYLFRAETLYEGLRWMTTDNAQKEEYLTEAVNHLASWSVSRGGRAYRVGHCVLSEGEVLTFNNPEELLAVEETFRRRSLPKAPVAFPRRTPAPGACRPVREWLSALDQGGEGLERLLRETYGEDKALWADRLTTFRRVLERFGALHGWERPVLLVRAPGRANLMGRHVEHRGGCINVIAISKEVVMAAAPREDDVVNVANLDRGTYPEASFRIGSELSGLSWDDWLTYLDHDRVQRLVKESRGGWVNYVKAAFLRLQFQCRDLCLRGMDAVFSGDIPVAAGLSSSSAVVVASAEAAVELNGLGLTPQDFVDLCGEGEWYVGSRGGAGDHAAMKYGRLGQVTQIRFFPFQAQPGVPFPEGYRLVIANSHVQARKMTNAKDMFNQRVASYEFGLMLLRERFPALAPKMERLRDVNPVTLGLRQSELYQMLRELPETLSPAEVRLCLAASYGRELERIFSSHAAPDAYLIRSVMLYGIAECQRSAGCRDLLERGDLEGLGRLMNISHDGDRVVRYSTQGGVWQSTPYDYWASDAYLAGLADGLESQELARVARAQLQLQPGGYACSTPEIDEMVDLSLQVPGVLGAQLSGAGLGGCIMVLLHEEASEALQATLAERFYEPRGQEPAFTISAPVRGSGLIRLA